MVLAWTACITPPQPIRVMTPFRIDQSDFYARIDTLCVLALTFPVEAKALGPRLSAFQSVLHEEIRSQGYVVIEDEAVNAAWRKGFDSVGDVFDPHTGRPDFTRLAMARERGGEALADVGCDAVVRPSIAFVVAPFAPTPGALGASPAVWDGASLAYGQNVMGFVGALSVRVRVEGLDGQLLFFGTGGIQTLASLSGGVFALRFDAIDDEAVLANEGRNRWAIQLAIRHLQRPEVEASE